MRRFHADYIARDGWGAGEAEAEEEEEMNLSALERFALVQLLLERDGGEVSWTAEEVQRMAEVNNGWAAVVMVRPEGIAVRAVSPERRAELIAAGWHEQQ